MFIYIWNTYWAVKLIKANGTLMDGSEDGETGWGFGQVSAVVAVVGWVHGVVSSWLSKFIRSPGVLITRLTRRN